MPIERDTFEELCASYALGALEPQDVQLLEQALAEAQPDDMAFFQTMQEVALMLPLSLDLETPPLHIRQRLLDEVRRRKSGVSTALSSISLPSAAIAWWQRLTLVWSMTAALFVVGIGLSYYTWDLQGQFGDQKQQLQIVTQTNTKLKSSVATLQQQTSKQAKQLKKQQRVILAMKNDLQRKTRLVKLLARRNVELVRMEVGRSKNLKEFAGGHGKLIWDAKSNQAILQLAGLPQYKDKVYQLWMMERGGKVLQKAGFYKYEGDRYNYYKAPVPRPKSKRKRQRIQFAVSLEPNGGSPKPGPTGKVLMVSSKVRISL